MTAKSIPTLTSVLLTGVALALFASNEVGAQTANQPQFQASEELRSDLRLPAERMIGRDVYLPGGENLLGRIREVRVMPEGNVQVIVDPIGTGMADAGPGEIAIDWDKIRLGRNNQLVAAVAMPQLVPNQQMTQAGPIAPQGPAQMGARGSVGTLGAPQTGQVIAIVPQPGSFGAPGQQLQNQPVPFGQGGFQQPSAPAAVAVNPQTGQAAVLVPQQGGGGMQAPFGTPLQGQFGSTPGQFSGPQGGTTMGQAAPLDPQQFQAFRANRLANLDQRYGQWRLNQIAEMDQAYANWRANFINRLDQAYLDQRNEELAALDRAFQAQRGVLVDPDLAVIDPQGNVIVDDRPFVPGIQ